MRTLLAAALAAVLVSAVFASGVAAQGVSEQHSDLLDAFGPVPETARGWQICNQSGDDKVWVAYSVKEGDVWMTHGWREIALGECSTILDKIETRYVYYYADGADIDSWSGEKMACVHPTDGFEATTTFGETCAPGYVQRGFVEVDTGTYKQFTTRLLP